MRDFNSIIAVMFVALAMPADVHAADRAGVAAQVNPAVSGEAGEAAVRVIRVGSDVYRNERISTDASGVTHLLFLDRSALTIGPGSEVVIDRFVYDPDRGAGELVFSTTRGVMRFVGGALSKDGRVKAQTPLGSLGIRGAVVLLRSGGSDAATTACMAYGDVLSGTHAVSGQGASTAEHESCLTLQPDGDIQVHAVRDGFLRPTVRALQGPERDDDGGLRVRQPQNLDDWSRQVRLLDAWDQQQTDITRPYDYRIPVAAPSPTPDPIVIPPFAPIIVDPDEIVYE